MALTLENICPLFEVHDVPRSLAFNRNLLGFGVVREVPPGDGCNWCVLSTGDGQLMLNTMYEQSDGPPAQDPARTSSRC